MKILIEHVPAGARVVVSGADGRPPVELVLSPAEVQVLVRVLLTAATAEAFRFEFER